jgi:hypothetical protein
MNREISSLLEASASISCQGWIKESGEQYQSGSNFFGQGGEINLFGCPHQHRYGFRGRDCVHAPLRDAKQLFLTQQC